MYYTGLIFLIMGLFRMFVFNRAPKKIQGTSYENKYRRTFGIVFILIGIYYFAGGLIADKFDILSEQRYLLIAICAVPAIIVGFIMDRRYIRLVEEDKENRS